MKKCGRVTRNYLLHKMFALPSLFALSVLKVQIMQIMQVPYSDFLHYLLSDERCEKQNLIEKVFSHYSSKY